MAKKVYDAVATAGKYNDRDGNEKKRYINVGSVFEDDQGRMSLKIDSVPVGQEWNGWVSFYEPKDGQGSKTAAKKPAQRPAAGGGFNDLDDDVPY